MSLRRTTLFLLLISVPGGCARDGAGRPEVTLAAPDPADAWREVLAEADAERIDQLGEVWRAATEPLSRRTARIVAAQGPVLVAAAALDHPAPSPGSYTCRLLRIGAGAGQARFRAYPPAFCYVGNDAPDVLSFTKQTGSELPAGRLMPAGARRYVFFGARQRRTGDTSLAYGVSPDRDVVGVMERVAPFRWRLVLPAAQSGTLDVFELTPVPADRQPG